MSASASAREMRGCRGLLAAALMLGLLAPHGRLAAELVIDNQQQRWRPGETIDLLFRGSEAGARIEAVLLDDQSVPFELLGPGARKGDLRLRIRLPADLKSGGHAISVVLAAAPPPKLVLTEVPDLAGLELAAVGQRLAQRGLTLAPVAAGPGSVVWEQEPAAGVRVKPGAAVTVRLSSPVPPLVGLRLHPARVLLLDLGLKPVVELRRPADGPYETVLEQQPAAGLMVAPGAAVTVVAESTPDPPPPRRPWPWLAVVAALAAVLGARARARWGSKTGYRLDAHAALEDLRAEMVPAATGEREPGLGLRLISHPDPGRQSLEIDAAAGGEEEGR